LKHRKQKGTPPPAETYAKGWGDVLETTPPNTIQLLLQNIGSINFTESISYKVMALCKFSQRAQIDIVAITECNVTWDKAPHKLQLKEQTKFWWENSKWSMAYNRNEP